MVVSISMPKVISEAFIVVVSVLRQSPRFPRDPCILRYRQKNAIGSTKYFFLDISRGFHGFYRSTASPASARSSTARPKDRSLPGSLAGGGCGCTVGKPANGITA
jgi:hypothetical protein